MTALSGLPTGAQLVVDSGLVALLAGLLLIAFVVYMAGRLR